MDADDEKQIIAITIDAIDVMQKAAHAPSDRPHDALQMISVMIDVLRDGLTGKTTPEVVAAELKALTDSVSLTDIQNKFDPGGDS